MKETYYKERNSISYTLFSNGEYTVGGIVILSRASASVFTADDMLSCTVHLVKKERIIIFAWRDIIFGQRNIIFGQRIAVLLYNAFPLHLIFLRDLYVAFQEKMLTVCFFKWRGVYGNPPGPQCPKNQTC